MSFPDLSQPSPGDPQPLAAAAGLRVDAPQAAEPRPAREEEWSEENFFRVVLNLEGGDWVELDSFPDEQSADECAARVVAELAEGKSWPRVRSRFLRPETILSVEVSERRRYTGSAARASWGKTLPSEQ